MEVVLEFEKNRVFLAFIIVTLTAPTLGVIIGGIVTSFLGGYENIKASFLCLIGALGATLLAIPIPFLNNFYAFISVLYGILIFGGAIFPSILGVIISSVPNDKKATASSFTVALCNLFGYIPSPFVYGLVNEHTKVSFPRLPFIISMYMAFFGLLFISFSLFFRIRLFKQNEKGEITQVEEKEEKILSQDATKPIDIKPKTSVDYIKDSKASFSIAMLYHNAGTGDLIEEVVENTFIGENEEEEVTDANIDLDKSKIKEDI